MPTLVPYHNLQQNPTVAQILPICEAARKTEARAYVITALDQAEKDIIDECAVLTYKSHQAFSCLSALSQAWKQWYRSTKSCFEQHQE